MIIHYGYTDGRGEFYITIDTDKCDGCGKCVEECPLNIFELTIDDYDQKVVKVKDEVIKNIGYLCPGYKSCKKCQKACDKQAITHSW